MEVGHLPGVLHQVARLIPMHLAMGKHLHGMLRLARPIPMQTEGRLQHGMHPRERLILTPRTAGVPQLGMSIAVERQIHMQLPLVPAAPTGARVDGILAAGVAMVALLLFERIGILAIGG